MTSNLKTSQPRRAKRSHILIVALLFLLQWLFLFNPKQGVWDAAFYYTFVRSVAFDHDLDLTNDITLSYPEAPQGYIDHAFETVLTPTGRVDSPFAIGSPMLWLPWLWLMRGGYGLATILGWANGSATGYEWFFIGGLAVFSAILGGFAFWLGYKMVRRETSAKIALLVTVTFMFTTPLIYYQFREPLYSHAFSALTTSLVIYAWWRSPFRPERLYQAALLGGLIGLSALVRWQHMVYLILPGLTAVLHFLNLPAKHKAKQLLPTIRYVFIVGLATGAVFSIQMALWRLFYGSWVTVPQGEAYVDWAAPFLQPTLFSTYRGVLPWMPILFLAVIGLLTKVRKRPLLILPLLAVLLLELYINSSTRDWFGGGGFGPRRYTSELAILMLGYAFLLQHIPRRIRYFAGSLLGLGLATHQFILLRFGIQDKIGGYHTSMYPTYNWVDVNYATYWQSITRHLPDLWRQPLDTFIFPASPLSGWVTQGVIPIQHIVMLLATVLFLAVVGRVWRWGRETAVSPRSYLALLTTLLVAIDLWILYWA